MIKLPASMRPRHGPRNFKLTAIATLHGKTGFNEAAARAAEFYNAFSVKNARANGLQ